MKIEQASWLVGCTPAFCTPANVGADTADEAQIRAHYAAISKALVERSAAGAMAGYADDVLVFDISPPMAVTGKERSERTYDAAFEATVGPWSAEFTNMKIKIIDARHAYVTAFLHQSFTMKSGEKVKMKIRLTDILENREGNWRVVHEHISAPVDMQHGRADFNATDTGDGKPFEE